MASIRSRTRKSDGGLSYYVVWRQGGARTATQHTETFSTGSDAQNKARAEGFKRLVEEAGERWPTDWIKGEGFVRERPAEVEVPCRTLEDVANDYYDQHLKCSVETRDRSKAQIKKLVELEFAWNGAPYRPFAGPIQDITEDDVRLWLREWPKPTPSRRTRISLKTLSNHHGTLFSVFNYALRLELITINPCARTGVDRKAIKQEQPDKRFLREDEFARIVSLAVEESRDMLRVAVATGLRFGEITALMVSDIDFAKSAIRVNKAWKRDGKNGEQDIPQRLQRMIKPKHRMRGHHLGITKTLKSRRRVAVDRDTLAILEATCRGKEFDDLVFTSPTGLPIHHADWYERVMLPLMSELRQRGIEPFSMHDLRHTHVAWLIAAGIQLPYIQVRLGHESIITTIDTYGHLLPQGEDDIRAAMENVMRGEQVVNRGMRLIQGGRPDDDEDSEGEGDGEAEAAL